MSVEHMALVFEADELAGPEKLLLLAYANFTDPHGYCWPGVDRLAAMTGTSKSTVIRTRKGLEARNLLRHQRRTTKAGDRDTNMYRINLDKLRSMRRQGARYDDNVMGLEFADEHPETNTDQGTDLHKYQSDTTPSESGTTPSQNDQGGSVNLKPRSSQSDTQSVIDPSEDPSRPKTRQTDGPSPGAKTGETPTDTQLADANQIVAGLDLSQIGPTRKQLTQITRTVAAVLAQGIDRDTVASHARSKAANAKTVKWFLGGFTDEHLPAPVAAAATKKGPDWCGRCGTDTGDDRA